MVVVVVVVVAVVVLVVLLVVVDREGCNSWCGPIVLRQRLTSVFDFDDVRRFFDQDSLKT